MGKGRFACSLLVVVAAWPAMGQAVTNAITEYSGSPVKLMASIRLEGASFSVYEPPFKAKGVYFSTNEALCRTPEELVVSIQSETNQEWVNCNWLGGKGQKVTASQFATRQALDKNANYFELVHKLAFLYNGCRTAIIKYWFVDDGKRTHLANMIVQEKDGRWYRTSVAGLEHLSTVIMRVKSDYMMSFFRPMSVGREVSGGGGTNDSLKPKLMSAVLGDGGVLDSERLYNEIMRLRADGKTNELFQWIDVSAAD